MVQAVAIPSNYYPISNKMDTFVCFDCVVGWI